MTTPQPQRIPTPEYRQLEALVEQRPARLLWEEGHALAVEQADSRVPGRADEVPPLADLIAPPSRSSSASPRNTRPAARPCARSSRPPRRPNRASFTRNICGPSISTSLVRARRRPAASSPPTAPAPSARPRRKPPGSAATGAGAACRSASSKRPSPTSSPTPSRSKKPWPRPKPGPGARAISCSYAANSACPVRCTNFLLSVLRNGIATRRDRVNSVRMNNSKFHASLRIAREKSVLRVHSEPYFPKEVSTTARKLGMQQ